MAIIMETMTSFDDVVQSIVEYGHLHILEAFYHEHVLAKQRGSSHNKPDFDHCMIQAVIYGRMEIVQWLYERNDRSLGITLTSSVLELCCYAIDNGQREIFQWLFTQKGGRLFTAYIVIRCIQQKQKHILKWLKEHEGNAVDEASEASGASGASEVSEMREAEEVREVGKVREVAEVREVGKVREAEEVREVGGASEAEGAGGCKEGGEEDAEDGEGDEDESEEEKCRKYDDAQFEVLCDHVQRGRTLAIEKFYVHMPVFRVDKLVYVHETLLLLAAAEGHVPVLEWIHSLGFLRLHNHPRETILTAVAHGRVSVLDYMKVICPSTFDEHYIAIIIDAFHSGYLPVLQWCYDHMDKMDERFFEQFGTDVIQYTVEGEFLHVFTWLESIASDVFPQFTALIADVPLRRKSTDSSHHWKMIKKSDRSTSMNRRARRDSEDEYENSSRSLPLLSSISSLSTQQPSSSAPQTTTSFTNIMTFTAAASTIVNNMALLSSSPVLRSLQLWMAKKS